jgi:hypothetical protein
MLDQAPGSTIRRKGLYSTTGFNRVVYRCYPPGYGWVGIYQGKGNDPLTWAYDAAQGKPGCVFNVSQVSLPIFTSPFPTFVQYNHGTGFDFAKAPYNLLDVSEFGQAGSSAATVVDWRGRDRSNAGFINGHDGHDWGLPKNTPIYSVAAGTVVLARNFQTPCTGSDSKVQKEVAIRHTVSNPSGYRERFVTYYAHLSSYSVKVGDFVQKGKAIGLSGNTGCSSAPHLHFGTIRETNTADQPVEPVQWFDDAQHNSGRDEAIEPYGWDTPRGFDPWSYRAYPAGALSVNLWATGKAPSTGNW